MLLNEGRYKRGHGLFCAHHRRLWRQDGRTQIPVSVVARAKGMAQIAEQTGLSREQLYRSFSEKGNPTLKTTLAVMQALGIELTAKIPSAA